MSKWGYNNIIYLQCDARYNEWLLRKIDDKCVVEYTIEKCKVLGCKKIIAGIYSCDANEYLVKVLKNNNVEVRLSTEEDVNKRFLKSVLNEYEDYCIRIGGDQLLIDCEEIRHVLDEMKKQQKEFFFEQYISCVVPDIVSIGCLKKYVSQIENENRYFIGLEKIANVKRYYMKKPILVMYDFRVNSNESFRICSNIIRNNLDIYKISTDLVASLIRSQYLNKTGLLGSWIIPKEYSDFYYDENEEINPWIGRAIIDYLRPHIDSSMSVFEWGSGNSTLFWSQNVKEVTSIEYDKKWYTKMLKVVPQNAKVEFYPLEYDGDYCRAILKENKKFDIILIDGRDRVRCAQNAIQRLKENGIIIWDDTDRKQYQQGYDFLKQQGFKRLEMSSIIYGIPGFEAFTSIFYRQNNFLDL